MTHLEWSFYVIQVDLRKLDTPIEEVYIVYTKFLIQNSPIQTNGCSLSFVCGSTTRVVLEERVEWCTLLID